MVYISALIILFFFKKKKVVLFLHRAGGIGRKPCLFLPSFPAEYTSWSYFFRPNLGLY